MLLTPLTGTLVLDEADRLLEAGFRRELVKIIEALPDRQTSPRQTLLFSATIPKEVHTVGLYSALYCSLLMIQIANLALSKDHKFITTLSEEDVNTHEHVVQESLIVPSGDIIPATLEALKREEHNISERGGFKGKPSFIVPLFPIIG